MLLLEIIGPITTIDEIPELSAEMVVMAQIYFLDETIVDGIELSVIITISFD
jgi:hypothetical protein